MKKKLTILIILIMVAFTVLSCIKVEAYTQSEAYFCIGGKDNSDETSAILGDVNLDGLVTSVDRNYAGKYNADYDITLGPQSMKNMDITKDGSINSADATFIGRLATGLDRSIGVNELKVGNSIALYSYYSATGGEIGEIQTSGITWTSSNTSIATITTSNGKATVRGIKAGDVTIKANNGTYEDSFVLHIVKNINKIMKTGISIESENVRPEETTHDVKITIDNSLMDNGLAGASMNISYTKSEKLLYGEPTIDILTENWSVKEKNYDDSDPAESSLDFIVELDDESLKNEATNDKVEIILTYNVLNTGENVSIYLNNLIRTDIYNNTTNDFYDYPSIDIIKEDVSIPEEVVTVDSSYTENIKIYNNNMYVKLDSSSSDGGNSYDIDLINHLTSNVSDYKILTLTNTDSAGKLYTGTKLNVGNSSGDIIYTYNIYLIGDLCTDSTHKIDSNDVIYLRQAIVGASMKYPSYYEHQASDVNWSNGTPETPGTGDIGDVIAIRRRILNYVWD